MSEEVKMREYEGGADDSDSDEGRVVLVLEWEKGLPNHNDLTPLSQPLISPELASAFSICPEPLRTMLDVKRASQTTFANLRGGKSLAISSNKFKSFNGDAIGKDDPIVVEWEDAADRDGNGSDSRKLRKLDCAEEENTIDGPSSRTSKRPRLVWTPKLHKRFVDVVGHLGIKSAVPKTIMQLMNVEGLTRENVASHLQKYRLYLKRMQRFSDEGPSSSDKLFASTPVPQSFHESNSKGDAHGNGHLPDHIPMPYPPPPMMPMPFFGIAAPGLMGMPMCNPGCEGYPYKMMQQPDWSGNKYGSVMSYSHVAHNTANEK